MGLLKAQNNRRFGAPWDDDDVTLRKGWRRAASIPELTVLSVLPRDRTMANHIENLSQFLQSFGVAALALLFLPVLIAALARNVALALAASLLSFTSLMLFIAPTSATSGLALASGLGSFLVAVVSAVARGRMIAFDKQVADLTSRVNQLESAEQRRLAIEVKRRGLRK
jgi:K+-sensing histidine kinase KdpD